MRRWSLRELQEAIGCVVSHNALAKYEKGEMMPGSSGLLVLAKALNLPVDFFFRPFRWKVGTMHFRKKARFPVSSQKAIGEQTMDFVERYREIEELVGDVREFSSPFAKTDYVQSRADAGRFAAKLRKVWNLGDDPLPSVIDLMESQGIKVLELPMDANDFDGLCCETEIGPVVVLASQAKENIPRKRMSAAHELGHVVLQFPQGNDVRDEETAVKEFAGAFLLPERTFTDAFGKKRERWTVRELVEIKRQFGVSIMGIMKRAESLGLISESRYKSFCVLANRWKWRSKGEPGDNVWMGCEKGIRFQQLVRRAIAEEVISISKGAALMNTPIDKIQDIEMRQVIE
jgi:Zn-dependent peptidase ImmA (M78 family)